LYNAICRRVVREGEWRLIDPLQVYVERFKDFEEKCLLLSSLVITFLKEKLGVEVVDYEEFYEFISMDNTSIRIPKVFKEAIKMSPRIAIRTKDLLHLVYAHMLSSIHAIKYFLTRDVENFERVKDLVRRLLGIEVVLVR